MAHNHLADIESGFVTRTNIIGIRKALNADWRNSRGYGNSRTSPSISSDELDSVIAAINSNKPIVQGELHDLGVKLLQSKRYAKRWNARQSAIIADIAQFHLVDWFDANRGYYIPVFRVIGTNGDSFNYYNIPWQSGGNGPELY